MKKYWVTAIWTPDMNGDQFSLFPEAKAGKPMRVEVEKCTLYNSRKVAGRYVATIRPVGGDRFNREAEVYRIQVTPNESGDN
jgi:hypothetical protein